MADTTPAPSLHTPTARKGPVTLSPSSKGPAKAQQERKNSDPQTLPTFVSQQRRESAAAKGPILAGNKRKVEDEEHTSATVYHQIKAEGADQDTTHPGLQSSSQSKKPKIPSLKPDVGLAQEPTTTTPSQPPSATSIPQTTMFLHHILTLHTWLIPHPDAYIISANIDDIAHAMWQSAFDQGPMLARAFEFLA
ncbi:hypothetical protein ACET3X_001999 [Alternaria dauci]|uniref:Uncharacterized protein n=1 Tax=Alternaria dauci TaxID=48095 RepID=A0ABR3UZC0_9PLEO